MIILSFLLSFPATLNYYIDSIFQCRTCHSRIPYVLESPTFWNADTALEWMLALLMWLGGNHLYLFFICTVETIIPLGSGDWMPWCHTCENIVKGSSPYTCACLLTMAETGSRRRLSSLLPIALLCFSPLVLRPRASSSSLCFLGSCYCEDIAAPICFQHMGPILSLPKFWYLLFRAGRVIV